MKKNQCGGFLASILRSSVSLFINYIALSAFNNVCTIIDPKITTIVFTNITCTVTVFNTDFTEFFLIFYKTDYIVNLQVNMFNKILTKYYWWGTRSSTC
jgi:hypothetical protein